MKLYQRLGIDKAQLNYEDDCDLLKQKLRLMEASKDIPGLKMDAVSVCIWLIYDYYYLEKWDEARKQIPLLIEYTKELFFGDWRSRYGVDKYPPDPKIWKKYDPWTRQFQETILWASCIGDWVNVRNLAEYPTDECPIGRYEPNQICYWLLLLTGILRGQSLDELSQWISKIKNGKKNQYQQYLLAMLYAVVEKDSEAFNRELETFLYYCKKHTFIQKHIKQKITIDGSFMVHYARHQGLCVEYLPEFEDRIVKL